MPQKLPQIKYMNKEKPLFSVCLIGRNEAKVLPRALESLKEFRDRGGEIAYLDTGSTDNSADLMEKFGCKVERVGTKFLIDVSEEQAKAVNDMFVVEGEEEVLKPGDKIFGFSDPRNYCAENIATNDHIAWLDCDESYTMMDINKVNDFIRQGVDQFEYEFVFSHDFLDKPLLQFVQSKFYNKKKMHWVNLLHEVLDNIDSSNPASRRQYLTEDIFKNEHWQNQETNRTGYLRGLALDCYLNPGNDRNSHYFGRELNWHSRQKSAIKEFERHLTLGRWPMERAQSMIYIGDCHWKLGDNKKAVEWYHKAFQEDSSRREALIKLAEFYYREKDWQRCACYAAASLEIKWHGFYANNKYHYEHIPHELLAEMEWYLGNKDKSKEHYDKCLAYQPYNARFLHDYRFHYSLPKVSFLIPTLGRHEGLNRCVDSIDHLIYEKNLIEKIIVEDEPRKGVPIRMKEMFEKSTGEYIVFASNDTEFSPDSLMIAYLHMKRNDLLLCSFNTGEISPDEGNINEHFMIRADFVRDYLKGEIFDTEFSHVGCDNFLWAQVKKLGRAGRCEQAKVNHYHFSKGKAEMDEVYQLGWESESVKKDRELLARKLTELNT